MLYQILVMIGKFRPHPGPLPRGEGEFSPVPLKSQPATFAERPEAILPLPLGEGRGEGNGASGFLEPTELHRELVSDIRG